MTELNNVIEKVNKLSHMCSELGDDLVALGRHFDNIEAELSDVYFKTSRQDMILKKMKEALEEV